MAIAFDSNKVFSLQIERVSDGGFLVVDGFRRDCGDYRGFRLAATTIEEALKYCKRKLDTEHGAEK